MMYFNFLNFYTIFLECSSSGWEGMQFFFPFLNLSQPSLPKNKARMTFFNFLNFFYYFFGNAPTWVGRNGIQNDFFFLISFSSYLGPVWHEMKAKIHFKFFLYLFLIFLGMLQPGSVRNCTPFENFLLSLFQSVPA